MCVFEVSLLHADRGVYESNVMSDMWPWCGVTITCSYYHHLRLPPSHKWLRLRVSASGLTSSSAPPSLQNTTLLRASRSLASPTNGFAPRQPRFQSLSLVFLPCTTHPHTPQNNCLTTPLTLLPKSRERVPAVPSRYVPQPVPLPRLPKLTAKRVDEP